MQRKTIETILVWILAVALFGSGGYYFYASSRVGSDANAYDLKQIAATVDGIDIREADVTYMIDTMRSDSYGSVLEGEEWALSLLSSDLTPETLREHVIKNKFATSIMLLTDAAELGLYPNYEAIDLRIADQKKAFGDEPAWMNYVHAMGFADESSYRRLLEAQDVVSPLIEAMFNDSEPTQQEIDDFLILNAPNLTGKRSSAVVIDVNEETFDAAYQQAETALAEINSGSDFSEISNAYSHTDMPREDGGDMGWQMTTNLPNEYVTALETLDIGEVSTIVASSDQLFIILCTEQYEPDVDDFDPTSVPADLLAELLEYLPDYLDSKRPDDYFKELLESDRVVILPMPEGLPYDVDMNISNAELEMIDDVVGTGAEAQEGDLVRVTYVGTLEDGTVFDASSMHDGYYEFTIGTSSVIKGWHIGVVGMRVGGTRTLIIPPHLAYGTAGQGSIPPNATLTFVIELLAVNGDYGDAENSIDPDLPELENDAGNSETE